MYRFVLSVFLCFRYFVIFCLLCTGLFCPCSCGALFSLIFRLHNSVTAVVLAGGTCDSGRSMSVFLLILILCLWVRCLLVLFSLPLSYTRARGSVLVGSWGVFVAVALLCRLWGCFLLFHVFVPSDIVAAAVLLVSPPSPQHLFPHFTILSVSAHCQWS